MGVAGECVDGPSGERRHISIMATSSGPATGSAAASTSPLSSVTKMPMLRDEGSGLVALVCRSVAASQRARLEGADGQMRKKVAGWTYS